MVGRPQRLKSVQRAFWRGVAEGLVVEEAARRVGLSATSARTWFGEAGGMSPISLVELPAKGRCLSFAEREEIALGVAAGDTNVVIAARVGRHPSTVGREIKRNGVLRWPADYRAVTAQAKAEVRARRPKVSKLAARAALRAQVQAGLTRHWSPQQIARRLVADFPDDDQMRVSHEAIYQSLYVQGRGGLRRELTVCLRTGRALRKPRRTPTVRGIRIKDMVMISERPAKVEDRAVPGHWEGDLIIGAGNLTAIGTLVERTTRFCLLLHLPHDHTAETVRDAIIAAIITLPVALRRSLTWDQGIELARHAEIKLATDMKIYFCDPHSPWQRGTNENTNGLLRQYFPKGTDLSVHSRQDLDRVAAELNSRPRLCLDDKTPTEVMRGWLTPTRNR